MVKIIILYMYATYDIHISSEEANFFGFNLSVVVFLLFSGLSEVA